MSLRRSGMDLCHMKSDLDETTDYQTSRNGTAGFIEKCPIR
jgi:hypothetical protein